MKPQKPLYADNIFGKNMQRAERVKFMQTYDDGVKHHNQREPETLTHQGQVMLKMTTSGAVDYDEAICWYSFDDWQTENQVQFEKTGCTWQSEHWRYLTHWQAPITGIKPRQMVRYKIGAKITATAQWCFADNQANCSADAEQFALWVDGMGLPVAARQSVIYFAFIDRFNPGNGKNWRQTDDLRQPCGGTLLGLIEKLDEIKAMGFDAIWVSPVFCSPTHHGYGITDYFKIEPRLGTNEDYERLLHEAHQRGMRIIMDFVANHTADQHPAFQAALQDPTSPYRAWYRWVKYPHKYESFYGVKDLPNLNAGFGSPARQHLLDAIKFWLDKGVDAMRMDYANGLDTDFWVDVRRLARSKPGESAWTFGEIVSMADVQRAYGSGMDGTLDFMLCLALRNAFAQQTMPLNELDAFLKGHETWFPESFSRPSFIDNHDMNRFLFTAQDDVAKLKLALLMIYLLPHPPIVYYGTEFALSQKMSIHDRKGIGFDSAREPMPWHETPTADLRPYLAKLAEIRRLVHAETCLQQTTLHVDEDTWVFARTPQNQPNAAGFVVAINRSAEERTLYVPIKRWDDVELLHGLPLTGKGSGVEVCLPAQSAAVLR